MGVRRATHLTTFTVATPHAVPTSADAPLPQLRQRLDRRISEIAALSAMAERDLASVLRQRDAVYTNLRHSAALVKGALTGTQRTLIVNMVRALHDGLALHADRAQLEERVVGLRQRLEFLASERQLLEDVERAVGGRTGAGVALDVRGARLSLAARRIFHIVEDEHESLTQDILDGPMQQLSDAVMDAELAGRVLSWDQSTARESLSRLRRTTSEAATALHQRIARLAPVGPERSLPAAIRELLQQSPLGDRARLLVIGSAKRLNRDTELSAFRVVEAALDNAIRRGRAQHVEVVLSYQSARVSVVVKDDGEGFDVPATEARLGRMRGLGLIEMHERAGIAGGRVEIRSQTGAGTEVHLTLPVKS